MSFWCIYEATLFSEGSGQNNQPDMADKMTIINNSNWFQIKCGSILQGTDGKLWDVVNRDTHHQTIDVAPKGAKNGREARLTVRGNTVIVQTNWDDATRSLAGCRTTIAAV